MILNCEMCGTRYLVDSSDIGALGRHVRCAECGHEWFATTDGTQPTPKAVAADLPKAEPAPTPAQAQAVEEQAAAEAEEAGVIRNLPAVVPQLDYKGPALVLGIGTAALVGLLAVLVLARADIVNTFPAAAHAYRVVGFTSDVPLVTAPEALAPQPQLMLFDLRIVRLQGAATLSGRIENFGEGAAPAAGLVVYEYSDEDALLGRTDLDLQDQVGVIAPNGSGAEFEIEFTLHDPAATKLRVEVVPGAAPQD